MNALSRDIGFLIGMIAAIVGASSLLRVAFMLADRDLAGVFLAICTFYVAVFDPFFDALEALLAVRFSPVLRVLLIGYAGLFGAALRLAVSAHRQRMMRLRVRETGATRIGALDDDLRMNLRLARLGSRARVAAAAISLMALRNVPELTWRALRYRRQDESTTTSDGFLAGRINNALQDQRVAGLVQFYAIPLAMLVYFALNFVDA